MNSKNCSFKDHKEIEGKMFCQECNVYMCGKCENFHSKLCGHHHTYNIKEISCDFTGFCKIENHSNKLIFYCKTHNQLCCAACLCVLNDNIYGQHKFCNVCHIHDIKEEKEKSLKKNIKFLEDVSHDLKSKIKKLEILFEQINLEKEKLKIKVINIFTQIRNEINKREDEILADIDIKFNNLIFNDKIVNESKKLPNTIKTIMDNTEKINHLWNEENKLNFCINDCIKIEQSINEIKNIFNKMMKCLCLKLDVKFQTELNNISNNFLYEMIKCFGNVDIKPYFNDNKENSFEHYLDEKIQLGIKNIFAFNIETNLSTENYYLKNQKKTFENLVKRIIMKGIRNILAFGKEINIQIKLNN